MRSEHFRQKYRSVIESQKSGVNQSLDSKHRHKQFKQYLDDVNAPILQNEINRHTTAHQKKRSLQANRLNLTQKRLTTAISPYRDQEIQPRPGTVRNQIWKSAGGKKFFHRPKSKKNMIEENIRAVRRLNNINLLNKIQDDCSHYTKLNPNQKAKLFKNGIERGDDFIIFKRKNPKRKRFNETQVASRKHKSFSCVGVQKIKNQNPNWKPKGEERN